jgi:polysaccharide chain length determinant protein (PEP-CTERM system associated)
MNDLKFRIAVLLNGAWRRRYLIVTPMLILPIVGALISHFDPPKYQAHTSMLIQETAKMNPFLEDLAVSTMLNDRMSALSTLLNSRHVLLSVAKERGMIDDSTSNNDAERIIRNLSSSLTVSLLGKDFIKIELKTSSPDGMKETLLSVSNHFIEQLLAPERSSIHDSSEFLSMHIETQRIALDHAESELAEFKNVHDTATPEIQTQSLNQLASLKQTLSEKEASLAGVEKSLGSLDAQLSKTNPVVGKIEEQIIQIRSDLTLLQSRYTDAHSAVQAQQRALKRLELERTQLLQQNTPNLNTNQLWDMASQLEGNKDSKTHPLLVTQMHNLQAARSQYEGLFEEVKSLKAMISKLQIEVHSFGDNSKSLERLQRQVNVKRQLYEELMTRYEMAQLTGSLGVFEQNKRVKIIDLPFTPGRPANLPTVVFVIIGWFAGLFLGIGVATILEIFDTRIRRQDELETITQAPLITFIPKIASDVKTRSNSTLNLREPSSPQ